MSKISKIKRYTANLENKMHLLTEWGWGWGWRGGTGKLLPWGQSVSWPRAWLIFNLFDHGGVSISKSKVNLNHQNRHSFAKEYLFYLTENKQRNSYEWLLLSFKTTCSSIWNLYSCNFCFGWNLKIKCSCFSDLHC